MTRLFIILVLMLASASTFAESRKPVSRNDEPIKIVSDFLQTDNSSKVATFTGNVVARQADLTIYAEKLVVTYSEETGEISTVEFFVNVRIIQGDRRGQADHGIYNAKLATIVLDGKPKVFQNNDTVTGKVITYYLEQEKSEVTSEPGTRVEAVIHPKAKNNDAKPKKP